MAGTVEPDVRPEADVEVEGTESPERITVEDRADKAVFSNGLVTVTCNKHSGLATFSWNGAPRVKNAYSSVKLGKIVKSTDYTHHEYDKNSISLNDGIGSGRRFTIVHNAKDQPDLLLHFTLYEGKPFFLLQTEVRSSQRLSTNYLAAIVVESQGGVDIGKANQNRALRVPYDNDVWIRFESVDINSSGSGVSSEATAIYDNASRNGLIFGSVTHDTWKTGINFTASDGKLDKLEVFGGMALEEYSPLPGALGAC